MSSVNEGILLVVSGPAGVGKGSIDRVLLERYPNMRLSVSATTRKPRPGEIDGVHYFFISEKEFKKMIDSNEFLEYMHVFDMNYYGTPRKFVEEELKKGRDIILEINVDGALKIKEAFPDAILIFVAPPSMAILKERLIGRNTETLEQIEKRFQTAPDELKCIDKYDYVVKNDVLDNAVKQFESIIVGEKCKASRNTRIIKELLKEVEK